MDVASRDGEVHGLPGWQIMYSSTVFCGRGVMNTGIIERV